MEAVAQRAGIAVRYVTYRDFAAAVAALQAGNVDVIPDHGITPARAALHDFTQPFQAFRLALFARGTDRSMMNASDLRGRRLATVVSNAGHEMNREEFPDATIVVYESPSEAMLELLAARVDAVAYPDEVFLAIAHAAGVSDRIRALPVPLTEIRRAMAIRKGDAALLATLDAALDDLVGTAEYEEIYARWFGREDPRWIVRRVLWGALLLVAIVAAGMAVWRFRSVSRLARELTQSLAERDAARELGRREEGRFKALP
jgi:polar amino acid transport system substrate-binding protein